MSAEDLAETRFAFSPIWELVLSLRSMEDPAKHALHIPWVGRTREATAELDLSLLIGLTPSRGYMPDFITPPPETPFPEFEEELDRLLATPHEQVMFDMSRYRKDRGELPEAALLIEDDPEAGLDRLVAQMRIYWKTALQAEWPRIRALLEGDVLHRARQLALGGADGLFADLHRSIQWESGVLQVVKKHSCESHPTEVEIDCGGRGLVLIPAVFAWPDCVMMIDQPWQPTLSYSPRGVANLWEPEMPDAPGAMDELIGGTRAEIMRTLEIPMTTTEVATRLGVTPGAVSQQLATLRRAGVVEADRVGRGVYSRLTPLGQSLLELLGA
jgi:DNA-binding transcriptional ArsR family regulator